MSPYWRELLQDGGLLAVVLVNWLVTCAAADTAAPSLLAKQLVSVYISVVALSVNAFSLFRSAQFVGKPSEPPESVIGLFAEIVNLTQLWGALFATARYFSLPENHAFHSESMIMSISNSIFEMSLVQVRPFARSNRSFGNELTATSHRTGRGGVGFRSARHTAGAPGGLDGGVLGRRVVCQPLPRVAHLRSQRLVERAACRARAQHRAKCALGAGNGRAAHAELHVTGVSVLGRYGSSMACGMEVLWR